jgi:hypothetical protein
MAEGIDPMQEPAARLDALQGHPGIGAEA